MGESSKAGKGRGKAGAPEALIFEPTLLPSPFEEQSPQLCWDLDLPEGKVALTLAQFGWSAAIFARGMGAPAGAVALEAGTLGELAEAARSGAQVPEAIRRRLAAPWILAYERA